MRSLTPRGMVVVMMGWESSVCINICKRSAPAGCFRTAYLEAGVSVLGRGGLRLFFLASVAAANLWS